MVYKIHKREANKPRKVKTCRILILHRIYFNQCILQFKINKRYVIHWKVIFTLSIQILQCKGTPMRYTNEVPKWDSPCFKVIPYKQMDWGWWGGWKTPTMLKLPWNWVISIWNITHLLEQIFMKHLRLKFTLTVIGFSLGSSKLSKTIKNFYNQPNNT